MPDYGFDAVPGGHVDVSRLGCPQRLNLFLSFFFIIFYPPLTLPQLSALH